MTTDIEKQFFDTFGIKPEYQNRCAAEDEYWDNEELANEYVTFERYMDSKCGNRDCAIECPYAYQNEIYPQITDRIFLKLICIFLNTFQTFEVYRIIDIASLKEKILKLSMLAKDDIYLQVRTLFEEG